MKKSSRGRRSHESAANLDAVPFYHGVREALGKQGCPLCRLLARDADRYLDAVLWELVNDLGVRSELNQARGYCPQHGWMLVRAGAAVGIAILMRDVVQTLLDVLATNPVDDRPGSKLRGVLRRLDSDDVPEFMRSQDKAQGPKRTLKLVQALSPQAPCPVCARLEPREKDYVRTLVAHLEEPGGLAEAYRDSDGLCLSHFRLALASAPSTGAAQALVAAQQSVWERLHRDLGEFIRKNDQRFRDEPFGEERDAWRRALEAISGPPPRSESGRGGLTQSV
jgi:hypothetical protein